MVHGQAEAELCRVQGDEVVVAFGPPAAGQIAAELVRRPLLGMRPDPAPHSRSTSFAAYARSLAAVHADGHPSLMPSW
ncbi:hypothetical protein [Streptomyces sp. 16-176A]|uniref:hypothetical protein n=1 Tax=Streptomyces sp. 16-176A TaxID=2530458 RepID=UPI00345CC997